MIAFCLFIAYQAHQSYKEDAVECALKDETETSEPLPSLEGLNTMDALTVIDNELERIHDRLKEIEDAVEHAWPHSVVLKHELLKRQEALVNLLASIAHKTDNNTVPESKGCDVCRPLDDTLHDDTLALDDEFDTTK